MNYPAWVVEYHGLGPPVENQRNAQFDGRIMDVAKYPTSTLKLTAPIALGDGGETIGKSPFVGNRMGPRAEMFSATA